MGVFVKFAEVMLALVLHMCLPGLASAPGTWTLDDFEPGHPRGAGPQWIVIADDLLGSATDVRLDPIDVGGTSGGHALRLSGTLAGERSFAGAWLPLDGVGRSRDLSRFQGIRLRVRGHGPLDVGFRAGLVNAMAPVDAGPEWRTVEVPLSRLQPRGPSPAGAPWSLSAVQVFGVTTSQVPSSAAAARDGTRVEFEIDDVTLYSDGPVADGPTTTGPAMGLALVPFTDAVSVPLEGWTEAATDPEGDSKGGLPDAIRLDLLPAAADDVLWARVRLKAAPTGRWVGINLALDVDGDPANGMAWWGANSAFKFDRLVTVYCFRVAGGCQGFIGIGDAAQVAAGQIAGPGGSALQVAITTAPDAFVVGVPRRLLGLTGREARVIAAVGSALLYADDVPGTGAVSLR